MLVLHRTGVGLGQSGAGVDHQVAWSYERAEWPCCSFAALFVLGCFRNGARLVLPSALRAAVVDCFWLVNTMR